MEESILIKGRFRGICFYFGKLMEICCLNYFNFLIFFDLDIRLRDIAMLICILNLDFSIVFFVLLCYLSTLNKSVGQVQFSDNVPVVHLVTSPPSCYQETRNPLPADKMLDIWERTKDYGVLFGKGGRFGNVRIVLFCMVSFKKCRGLSILLGFEIQLHE